MYDEYYGTLIEKNDFRAYLSHDGVKGMKWGIRHKREAQKKQDSLAMLRAQYKLGINNKSAYAINKAVRDIGASANTAVRAQKAASAKAAYLALSPRNRDEDEEYDEDDPRSRFRKKNKKAPQKWKFHREPHPGM